MKRTLPIAISFVAGLIYIMSVFFANPFFTRLKTEADLWYQISISFAVFLGVLNLTFIHWRTISQKRKNWEFSVVLLVAMYGLILLGLYQSNMGSGYQYVFNNALVPLDSTMFAMLAFHIASAAFRAFRLRSVEATLMLVAGIIIMLGNVPIGVMMYDKFPAMGSWLLRIPNTAGMRGITIAATLGATATALRIMLGIERGHLGTGE